MRRILASLMALIMLVTSVPALADGSLPAGRVSAASTTKGGGSGTSKVDYTVTLAKSPGFEAAYAIFTKSGHVYSDENLTKPAGEASRGDVVYALQRKGFGTGKARVKVSWVCGGKAQTGWVKANFLRLMNKTQRQEYVNEVKNNKKLVKVEGRYLLPIAAYKKAASATAAPTKAPQTSTRAELPKTTITGLTTQSAGLRVRWKAVEGAVKYQIWRSTKHNTGFTRLITVTGVTEWRDTTAKKNTAYYYQVRCVFEDGSVSISDARGRWNDWGPAITTAVNASTGAITLSWAAKASATNYAIYRADEGSSTYKKIATVTGLSYVDTSVTKNNVTYSYYIVANYKLATGQTVPGTIGAAKSVTYGVQPVASVTATNVAGGVQIKWPKVANATGYRVLYRVGTTGTWTKLTTTGASVLTYKHTAPAYGQQIQYAVRTEGKVNGKAVLAAVVQTSHAAVAKPTLTLKAGEEGVINATWAYVKGANAYVLFYKHEDDSEYTRVDLTKRTYQIPAVKAGKYTAYVRGRYNVDDTVGYPGPVSATVSLNAAGVDLSAVPQMTLSLSDTPNMLQVSWNAVDDAAAYEVEVTGKNGTTTYWFSSYELSGVIAVNEGDYSVAMHAVIGTEDGRSCDAQTITADWAEGVYLSAPVVTVAQSEEYNYADISWTAVDGAEEYFVTVSGNGETRSMSVPVTSVTMNLAGEGSYTIIVKARVKATGAVNEFIVGDEGVTATTFAWSDEVKYTPKLQLQLDDPNWIIASWNEVPDAEEYVVTVYGENDAWMDQKNTASTAALLCVNGGETVRVSVYAVVDGENKPSSDWLTVDAVWDDMIAMTAPTVSCKLGQLGSVTVSWTAVEDADGYSLLVTGAGEGAGQYDTAETSFTLTVTPGVAYQFNVVPHAKLDGGDVVLGPRSGFVNCYPVWSEATVPEMIFGLSTTPNVLLVSWDPLAAATGYVVEVTGASGGTNEYRTTDTALAVPVNGGESYTARMYAVLGDTKGEWCASQTVKAEWADMVALTAPVVTLSKEWVGVVTVSWDPVPGADQYCVTINDDKQIVEGTSATFDVEPGAMADITVEPIGKTTAGKFSGPVATMSALMDWTPEMTLALSATSNFIDVSWTDVTSLNGYVVSITGAGETKEITVTQGTSTSILVNGGETYQVKVAARDVNGNPVTWCVSQSIQAVWSNMVSLTQGKITSVTWDPEAGEISAAWDEVPGATGYYFYVGTEADEEGKYSAAYETDVTSHTTAAAAGQKYKVAVRPVYQVGDQVLMGPVSDAAWVTAVDVTVAPANVTADVSRTNYVTFAWEACQGATGYVVYYDGRDEYVGDVTSVTYWTPDYDCSMTVGVCALYEIGDNAYESNRAELTFSPVWGEPAIDLPAPVVSVACSADPNYLDISWDPIDDATYFLVVAYDDADNRYEWETTGTSLHKWVSAGRIYTVQVYPVYVNGEHAESSIHRDQWIFGHETEESIPAMWDSAVTLAKPVITATLSATPNYVLLTWDEVEGATGYYVNHMVGADIVTGTSLTVMVPGNGSWGFDMYAFNGDPENCGPWSNVAVIEASWPEDEVVTVGQPYVSVNTDTPNVITLSWDEVEGADGYQVSVSKGNYDNVYATHNLTSTGMSFPVNGDGTKYCYTVRAKKEHPLTGDDVLSLAWNVSAVAQWDNGICMVKPAITATPGTYDGMTDTIPYTVSWTAQEKVAYRLAYTPKGGETVYTDATTDSSLTVKLADGVEYTLQLQQYINVYGITKTWGPDSDKLTVTPSSGIDVTAVPTGVTIDVSEANRAVFSWNACASAAGYEYSFMSGHGGATIYTVATGASHFVPDVGEDDTFMVRAVYYKGGKTYYSAWVKTTYTPVWTNAGVNLTAPVVAASCAEEANYLLVTWDEVRGADYYDVNIFAFVGDGTAKYQAQKVTDTSALVWVNAGVEYTVAVTAHYVDEDSNEVYSGEAGMVTVNAAWDSAVAIGGSALTIEKGVEPNTVKLSWTAADDADGYVISFMGEEYFYDVLSVILPVPCDGQYTASICAWAGDTSRRGPWNNSEVITVSWDDAMQITEPVITADKTIPNTLSFTWTAVEGATGYNVLLEKKVNGEFQKVTSGTYTDTKFSYVVNGDGSLYRLSVSAYYNTLESTEAVCLFPATWADGVNLTPRTISVYANSYNEETNLVEVFVEWEADPDASGYHLQWIPAGSAPQTVTIKDGSTTSYALELEKGVEHSISMMSFFYHDGGYTPYWGPNSNVVRYTPAYGVDTLVQPELTSHIDEDGYLVFAWEDDPNAFSYTLSYRLGSSGSFTEVYVPAEDDDGNRVHSYRILPESGSDKRYQVYVCANWEEDGGLEHGPVSDTETFSALAPAIGALALTQSDAPNYMNISWAAVPGATRYYVGLKDDNNFRAYWVDASVTDLTVLVSSGQVNVVTVQTYVDYAEHSLCSASVQDSLLCSWTDGVTVKAPANVTAAVSDTNPGEVVVSWDAVPGVTGYLVQAESPSCQGDAYSVNVTGGETACKLVIPAEAWFEDMTVSVLSYLDDGTEHGHIESGSAASASFELAFYTAPIPTLKEGATPYEVVAEWEDVPGDPTYFVRITDPSGELYPAEGSEWISVGKANSYTFETKSGCDYVVEVKADFAEAGVSVVDGDAAINPAWELSGLTATMTADDENMITVEWDEDPDTTGYTVWWQTAGDEEWYRQENVQSPWIVGFNGGTAVNAFVTSTWGTFSDGTDKPGLSCEVMSATARGITLTKPVMTLTARIEGQIDVSWTKVPGASCYYVFYEIDGEIDNLLPGEDDTSGVINVPVEHFGKEISVWMIAAYESGEIGFESPASDTQTITAEWVINLTAPKMTLSAGRRGYIGVSWEPIDNATKYRIFYKPAGASGFSSLYVDGTADSVDIPAANNVACQVYMRAIHVSMTGTTTSGTACAAKTITPAWTAKLAAPVLTVTNGARGVLKLNWTEVPGAAGYVLSYKKATDSAYTTETFNAQYLSAELPVTAEETYELYIAAFEGESTLPYMGKASSVQTYFATWAVTLAKPVMTLTQGDFRRLVVSWGAVENATEYRIFYKTSDASGYSSVTVDGTETSAALAVANNTTYQVYMRAINVAEDGVRTSGPICTAQTITTAWDEPDIPVPELTAKPVSGDDQTSTVQLTWTVPDDTCGYRLYYRINDEDFTSIDVTDLNAPTYEVTVPTGSVFDCYAVAYRIIDDEVYEGDPSETVSVLAAYGVHALTAPEMTLTLGAEGELVVSWQEQSFAGKYTIYYKTREDATYFVADVIAPLGEVTLDVAADQVYQVYMTASCTTADGAVASGPACEAQEIHTFWVDSYASLDVTVTPSFNGKVEIQWTADDEATGYLLNYSLAGKEQYTSIPVDGDTTAYTLYLTAETQYDVFITASYVYEDWSWETGSSDVVRFTTLGEPSLTAPVMTAVRAIDGAILVRWDAVPGATEYRIFYKTSSASTYSSVTVSAPTLYAVLPTTDDAAYNLYMRGIYVDDNGERTSGPICTQQTVAVSGSSTAVATPDFTVMPVSGDAETTRMLISWYHENSDAKVSVFYRIEGETGCTAVLDQPAEDLLYVDVPTGETLEVSLLASRVISGVTTYSAPTHVEGVKAAYGVHALTKQEIDTDCADGDLYVWLTMQSFASGYNVYVREEGTEDYTCYTYDVEDEEIDVVIPLKEDTYYEVYAAAYFLDEDGTKLEGPASDVIRVYNWDAPDYVDMTPQVTRSFGGQVTVSWEALPEANLYVLEYWVDGGEDWNAVEIRDAVTATLDLEPDTDYVMYINAFYQHTDGDDVWDFILGSSGEVAVTTLGDPALAAPTMTLALSDPEGYVNVSWTAVENATRYSLFYRSNSETNYTNVKLDASVLSYQIPVAEDATSYQVYVRGIYDYPDGSVFSGTMCQVQTIRLGVGDYRALLIGQTYPGTANALPGPDVDANAMKAMLQTMTATPYSVSVKTNLTASGIISAIGSTFGSATEDDVSLFYYSGHGAFSETSSYLGALCGTDDYIVTVLQLKAALDKIPGAKIVILDSCHSGAHIGKSVTVSSTGYTAVQNLSSAFNNSVISAFSSVSRSNLATDGYYVMTASHSSETSQSISYDRLNYVGLFTYAMLLGCGYDEWESSHLSSLYCDSNGDSKISLQEAYSYAYSNALEVNPDQNAQVYPTNSSFELWGR